MSSINVKIDCGNRKLSQGELTDLGAVLTSTLLALDKTFKISSIEQSDESWEPESDLELILAQNESSI